MDRFDIQIQVSRPGPAELMANEPVDETTPQVARRVSGAHLKQVARGSPNAGIGPERLMELCRPGVRTVALLEGAAESFGLSARRCHRILRVARTIADLAGRDSVSMEDVSESIALRPSGLQKIAPGTRQG